MGCVKVSVTARVLTKAHLSIAGNPSAPPVAELEVAIGLRVLTDTLQTAEDGHLAYSYISPDEANPTYLDRRPDRPSRPGLHERRELLAQENDTLAHAGCCLRTKQRLEFS